MSNEQRVLELERQIEQLTRQLLLAQKMTALGELVSTTTHEFNNVLTTIINYAKLGLRHKDDASREKSFQKILTAGEKAARITNSVLGMARSRNDQFEPTQLRGLIEESLLLLEREMMKYRISIDCQLNDVPTVQANGNQIQQVLLNLLINSRQAMTRGGTIMIRLTYDETTQYVELLVRDNGCGIPQESLPRIFDPFFSTKQGPDATGKGGTGLGLSACRTIVEAHQGRIRVESSVGRGTSFSIKLPAIVATPTPTMSRGSAITTPA